MPNMRMLDPLAQRRILDGLAGQPVGPQKEMPLTGRLLKVLSSADSRLAARSSFRTESTRISDSSTVARRADMSSRWYSWRSSPSMATCAFCNGAGETASFESHIDATRRAPTPQVILRRLGGQRGDRDIRCVADLLLGIAADETDKSAIEVQTFLRFCPSCLGHPEASGRGSPDQKLLFWGDRHGGAEPERCRWQSRSFAGAGRRKSPEAVQGQRAGQETCLKSITVMLVAAAEEERTPKIVDSQTPSA